MHIFIFGQNAHHIVTQLLRLAQQFKLTKQFRNQNVFLTREYHKDKIMEK